MELEKSLSGLIRRVIQLPSSAIFFLFLLLNVFSDGYQIFASFNIGIKHGFPCINVCQVPREMLKTEAVGLGFQHLPRDRANVNVLENHV